MRIVPVQSITLAERAAWNLADMLGWDYIVRVEAGEEHDTPRYGKTWYTHGVYSWTACERFDERMGTDYANEMADSVRED